MIIIIIFFTKNIIILYTCEKLAMVNNRKCERFIFGKIVSERHTHLLQIFTEVTENKECVEEGEENTAELVQPLGQI